MSRHEGETPKGKDLRILRNIYGGATVFSGIAGVDPEVRADVTGIMGNQGLSSGLIIVSILFAGGTYYYERLRRKEANRSS